MRIRRASIVVLAAALDRQHQTLLIATGLTAAAVIAGIALGLREEGPTLGAARERFTLQPAGNRV